MIKSARWEGNEILQTSDMNNVAVSSIENLDFAFSIMGAKQIITGLSISQTGTPSMGVLVSIGSAFDDSNGELLYNETEETLSVSSADPTLIRRDIVEIRRIEEDITPQNRQFKDPGTGDITTSAIDTQIRYGVEMQITEGTPGNNAPSVTAGWVKLAEIHVPASASTITNSDILNCDADFTGDTNTGWTTQNNIIYRNGSISDMKTFLKDYSDSTKCFPSGTGFANNYLTLFSDGDGKALKSSGIPITNIARTDIGETFESTLTVNDSVIINKTGLLLQANRRDATSPLYMIGRTEGNENIFLFGNLIPSNEEVQIRSFLDDLVLQTDNGVQLIAKHTGGVDVISRLTAQSSSPISLAGISGASLHGSDGSSSHIAIDDDTVQRKTNGTTPGSISINPFGGSVSIGENGSVTYPINIYGVNANIYSRAICRLVDTVTLLGGSGTILIGSAGGSQHIAMDNNQIQSKSNATTPATISLNALGGVVNIGENGSVTYAVNIFGVNTNIYSRATCRSSDPVTLSGISGAALFGGAGGGQHIAIDDDTIQSKTSNIASGTLKLNPLGGDVTIGSGLGDETTLDSDTTNVSGDLNMTGSIKPGDGTVYEISLTSGVTTDITETGVLSFVQLSLTGATFAQLIITKYTGSGFNTIFLGNGTGSGFATMREGVPLIMSNGSNAKVTLSTDASSSSITFIKQ